MSVTPDILKSLNDQQRAAVTHTEGPVLVFAGAGSGKTRVLTHRIAHLIRDLGVPAYNILAVTFTNKAANEMKERIERLLGESAKGLWAGTFHGICARILRERGDEIGLDRNYVIFDDSDQMALVRESMAANDIDQKTYKPRDILNLISKAKEQLVLPDEFKKRFVGALESIAGRVYKTYQQRLHLSRALDFDDLIMYTVLLFKDKPDTLQHYQNKFRYILVDEYQDINFSQYIFVRSLAQKHGNIFCVGDDDQSIYRWRGADVGIILQFEKDYPNAAVYKLEQNYRSTKKILEAAHAVVQRNVDRAAKKLYTENDEGCDIEIIDAYNEIDEANKIAQSIQNKVSFQEKEYADIVVLYRMNAQSRVFEEAMINARIPHKLVGTVRFYERREIKDILAYLRLAANPHESISLRRVINVPTRGIGQTSISRLEQFAIAEQITLYEALRRISEVTTLTPRARALMGKFYEIIHHLNEIHSQMSVHSLTREVLEVTGYLSALSEEQTMEARNRLENVEELLSVTQHFETSVENPDLTAFLEQVALISDIDILDDSGNAVTLMTLHAAKGLEFAVVYMTGMEEGLFPHRRSMESREELAEERRLCYVGMTRAREELLLSYAHQRMLMGQVTGLDTSRFISEIPEHIVADTKPKRRRASASAEWRTRFRPGRTSNTATFRPAQKVEHDTFGFGIVLNCSGSGNEELVTVAFDKHGVKKLMVSLANLKKV
ncbi:MAG: UvrD-helicase domain-containing protein [Armatimonadetes bacterium]|jgi:DNA helicase-2/ATP-dependent DNA helicase PcrA|nr:UvrD-helicase domain-containing protein [Armatimonadota bacterium]